ncbi:MULTISPECIES: MFS transporter [Cyanophyceae]|uniref:MFS transporter n=1 Tax=Leptolyngbya subtilissima DQ-A4 TaxID=2933933 RepID=A0ABV0K1Y0_9CYAN|nr:MFS transporter [Nodosilinea sp. FACHB-141]MBD2111481.1 MFS transporter [Nodosilinea sp. FACHB-141]
MDLEPPSLRLLITMNLGFWGVQIGNGLQTAHASAVFESLGAEASQLPLLWLGAPLMGLLAQPIVGELSDRTVSRWGKRQPYFLGGAVIGAAMLLAMPLATSLIQAVALYWVLQLALNVSVAPSRPFVGDLLSPAHRTLGYSLQGFCIGLGTICAAGLPWILEHVFQLEPVSHMGIPDVIRGAYWVGAAVCLVGSVATFLAVDEPAPQAAAFAEELVEEERPPMLGAIAEAMAELPPMMRQLAAVQALSWAGIYCIFLYLPNAIALNVLASPDRSLTSYSHNVEWAGLCTAFYNLVCLGVSWVIPSLSQRWGRVMVHACCLMAGSVGLLSLLLVHSRYPVLLSMVGLGIAWASILAIPYSLLMDDLAEGQSGVYMGIFNGFITLPQIAMSLGFGWVMKTLLQDNRLWALALGGILLGLAALLMLRVTEPVRTAENEAVSALAPVTK